jgi:SAM-dependent methyltransferase
MANGRPSAGGGDNADLLVVQGFGEEWTRFPQDRLPPAERRRLFEAYFAVFPWHRIDAGQAVGADIGCGSGRWALEAAGRCHALHLIDASAEALKVAQRNLAAAGVGNAIFHHASVDKLPFADGSLDFAYSLGVLHHVPDTAGATAAVAAKLKPGAPLLLYLYYSFENRPLWFRMLWRASDLMRAAISRLPFKPRLALSQILALLIYWPLARSAALLDRLGRLPAAWPLREYRDKSLYTMRTDALDRFGTRLEQRFNRAEIETMMARAGLEAICFSEAPPYWCACGLKRADTRP